MGLGGPKNFAQIAAVIINILGVMKAAWTRKYTKEREVYNTPADRGLPL